MMIRRILLSILMLNLTGCIVVKRSEAPEPPMPNGKYTSQILAASGLKFPNDRADALRKIATREDLAEPDQLYLVEVLRSVDVFPNDRKDILLGFVKNPVTTQKARNKVASLLREFQLFPNDEKEILDAIINSTQVEQTPS